MNLKTCKVIKAYTSAYPDPIKVKAGEILKVDDKKSDWPGWAWCTNQEGKGGWLPDSYIKKSSSNCIVLCDYEATELTVETGETLMVGFGVEIRKEWRDGFRLKIFKNKFPPPNFPKMFFQKTVCP